MSDTAQGPGWWQASDGKWYPPADPAAGGAPAAAPGGQGTINVKATFFILAFLLYFFKPKGELDGQPVNLVWGSTPTSFPVAPGRHRVDVWCPYLFYTMMGRNSIEVDVAPGQAVTVHWKCPYLVFMKGKITASAG